MAKHETEAAESRPAAVCTKEQIAASKRYASQRDLVCALLEDGKAYTLAEADQLIHQFRKGKVR